jgi:uncharacterized protein YpiB (UPF0302 family)
MNPEYNFKKDKYMTSITEAFMEKEALKTQRILTQETTEYTPGANEIISKVQRQYMEDKRYTEIDRALDNKDKERFLALTSEGWERVLRLRKDD